METLSHSAWTPKVASPFIDMLALLLAVAPDQMTWQIMARKRPDKWLEAVAAITELAGLMGEIPLHERTCLP